MSEVTKENGIVSTKIISAPKWELLYFAKDNFWTKKFPTTASSAFLANFFSNQDATVIKLLTKRGYQLLGKTVLDEFACGGTGLYAATGPIFNPYDSTRVVGGSSSGSALTVAKKLAPFALGHDTGDSIRRPASYCGIIGFKPSYGLISRYGVIPMASSLDTIGILADKVSRVKEIFSVLAQKDPYDLLTVARKPKTPRLPKKKKIAIVAGLEHHLPPDLIRLYLNVQKVLEKLGYNIVKISLPKKLRENLQITYLILCSTELVSHLNCLQGITYGTEEGIGIINKRSEYLGEIVKERLLIGAYSLEKEGLLVKAQKMRHQVIQWLKKVFRNYRLLIFPSTNNIAPSADNFNSYFSGLLSTHWSDNLLLLANLAGLPSLSLPIGFVNGLPVSINLNSAYKQDKLVLRLAEQLENELAKSNQRAK